MFTFSVPTAALFGAGKLNELHTQINAPMEAVHGKKALVVISNGKSTRSNGYLDRLENELKQAGVEMNRKILADMAVNDAEGFAKLAALAKEKIA